MKRSNERKGCKRLHRALLGSVFLFCLFLGGQIISVNMHREGKQSIIESVSFPSINKVYAYEKAYPRGGEISVVKEDDEERQGEIHLLYGVRNVLRGLPLNNPFDSNIHQTDLLETDNKNRHNDQHKTHLNGREYSQDSHSIYDAAYRKNEGESGTEKGIRKNVYNKEKNETHLQIKGILYDEEFKAIIMMDGEMHFLRVGDCINGYQITYISAVEVKGTHGLHWHV